MKVKFRSEERIKRMLVERLNKVDIPRSKDTIHASDLTKPEYCPRREALMRKLGYTDVGRMIAHPLRITFDLGNDIQSRVNNDWLRDVMWGHWECVQCGGVVEYSFFPTDGACYCRDVDGSCLGGKWKYKEVRVHHSTGASGSMDGFVVLSDDTLRMIEIKTIAPDTFKDLKMPLGEHRVRTSMYLQMLHDSKIPELASVNTEKASVLYVCRSFGFKQEDGVISPLKEFEVEREEVSAKALLSKGQAVHQAEGSGMPCGICKDMFDKPARSCRAVKDCFSKDYMASTTWMKSLGGKLQPYNPDMKVHFGVSDANQD